MIFKNKSMFGRKYLTEVNVYFPYHNIFLSASHTLQKPQTKDNGFGSYFFFRKKEDFKFNFQSWSTFKKVQKIWIIELLNIDYHEKEKNWVQFVLKKICSELLLLFSSL